MLQHGNADENKPRLPQGVISNCRTKVTVEGVIEIVM